MLIPLARDRPPCRYQDGQEAAGWIRCVCLDLAMSDRGEGRRSMGEVRNSSIVVLGHRVFTFLGEFLVVLIEGHPMPNPAGGPRPTCITSRDSNVPKRGQCAADDRRRSTSPLSGRLVSWKGIRGTVALAGRSRA